MRGYNSTIRRNKKPCKTCGKSEYIFSKGRCELCARIEDTLVRDEKETEKVIQEEDLSGLIQDADAIFSQYVRLKNANKVGIVKCFTCPMEKHWTLMQNGHYIKRSHLRLRWDERNTRVQCPNCNEHLHGNMPAYTKNLELDSPGITEILQEEMRIVYKIGREEIRQIVSQYSPLVAQLKKKLQN